ncbi:transglutaminase-like domain-containing protein [Epilithonimonas caeni]|uniref:transglutaminase-like domain-containing protein n=1 Tax=Epilithonimonas caeni TaxID=365343 RepID=UPI000487F01C|nr:transglutaminase-like domain-containing protein [Epilithonimonas caeni]
MKTKILQLMLTCAILPMFAQYKFLDIPKLDNDDLKSTAYAKNPSEAAEILYKSYHYYISDGQLNLDVVSRVKIYKKDQAGKFLDQEIYTYDGKNNKSEKVTSLKVLTYNLVNDKVETTTVEKNSKYKSKESKNYTVTKFAFENVKDGSVIEYKYSVLSPYVWSVDKVTIEDNVPTRRFDYVLDFPKYLGFNIDYKGSLTPKNRDVADKNIYGGEYYTYRFGYENIAPYRDEKYVHNLDNYRTSIRAELNSTNITRIPGAYDYSDTGGFKSYAVSWNDIRKQLYESEFFGDQLKKKSLVKELLPADIKTISSPEEKAAAVQKFVQKNYTWNNYYTVGAEEGKGIRNLLETRVGSSGEINLLLILLMRSAGLDAQPVVLSTIGRGLLLDHSPSLNQLNYVLALVDIGGKATIYDATSKMMLPNLIRPTALNYNGYLMTEKEAKKINIFSPGKSTTYLTVDAKLNPDGTVTGNFSDRDTQLYAMMNNERYDQDKAAYQKESYKERYTFPFTNIKTELLDNNDFQTSFDFDSDSFVDGIGGKMVFNPLLFLYNKSHEFDQSDERRSPIELYTGYDKIKKVTVTLPDGYVFENVPKSKKFRTEDSAIQYVYKVTQEGNKLTVETTTTVEDPVYPKEYYPAFKQIFDNITKMEGQVVTAVKK